MKRRTVLIGLVATSVTGCRLPPEPGEPMPWGTALERATHRRFDDETRREALFEHVVEELAPIRVEEALVAFLEAHEKHGRGLPGSERQMRGFVERLLFSTDFFLEGADVARPPRFVQYYDPYISPCWDPMPARA